MGPKHQAFLLAFIIQETLNHFGREGEPVIAKAIQEYGQGRGRRMAKKARSDGCQNDLLGFLLYGEIDWNDTGNKFTIAQRKPYFKVYAKKCFWHDIWKKNMLDIGKIYCRNIDKAILQGFNNNLRFEVPCNMNNGSKICEFHYHDWHLGLTDLLRYLVKRKKAKKKAVESWKFHCEDVLHTFSRVIISHSEKDGKKAIDGAMEKFTAKFGKSTTDTLLTLI